MTRAVFTSQASRTGVVDRDDVRPELDVAALCGRARSRRRAVVNNDGCVRAPTRARKRRGSMSFDPRRLSFAHVGEKARRSGTKRLAASRVSCRRQRRGRCEARVDDARRREARCRRQRRRRRQRASTSDVGARRRRVRRCEACVDVKRAAGDPGRRCERERFGCSRPATGDDPPRTRARDRARRHFSTSRFYAVRPRARS